MMQKTCGAIRVARWRTSRAGLCGVRRTWWKSAAFARRTPFADGREIGKRTFNS